MAASFLPFSFRQDENLSVIRFEKGCFGLDDLAASGEPGFGGYMMDRTERVIDKAARVITTIFCAVFSARQRSFSKVVRSSNTFGAKCSLLGEKSPREERHQGAGTRNRSIRLRQGGVYIRSGALEVSSLPRTRPGTPAAVSTTCRPPHLPLFCPLLVLFSPASHHTNRIPNQQTVLSISSVLIRRTSISTSLSTHTAAITEALAPTAIPLVRLLKQIYAQHTKFQLDMERG